MSENPRKRRTKDSDEDESAVEEETKETAKPQTPKTILASALQELYDKRPLYNGREYNQLHKWYEELRKLTE